MTVSFLMKGDEDYDEDREDARCGILSDGDGYNICADFRNADSVSGR